MNTCIHDTEKTILLNHIILYHVIFAAAVCYDILAIVIDRSIYHVYVRILLDCAMQKQFYNYFL